MSTCMSASRPQLAVAQSNTKSGPGRSKALPEVVVQDLEDLAMEIWPPAQHRQFPLSLPMVPPGVLSFPANSLPLVLSS